MILGLYYLMLDPFYIAEEHGKKTKTFRSMDEVLTALSAAGSFNWSEEYGKEGRRDDLGRGIRIAREDQDSNSTAESSKQHLVVWYLIPSFLKNSGFKTTACARKR